MLVWRGDQIILSGTKLHEIVPDSFFMGTKRYLNVPKRRLLHPFGHKIIPICAGGLEVGNISLGKRALLD